MLDGALRLAVAAAVATGAGFLVRALLVQQLPGMQLPEILMRATILCAVGVGIYLTVARALGVSELDEIAGVLLRELRLTRHVGCHDPRSSAEGESAGRASWE